MHHCILSLVTRSKQNFTNFPISVFDVRLCWPCFYFRLVSQDQLDRSQLLERCVTQFAETLRKGWGSYEFLLCLLAAAPPAVLFPVNIRKKKKASCLHSGHSKKPWITHGINIRIFSFSTWTTFFSPRLCLFFRCSLWCIRANIWHHKDTGNTSKRSNHAVNNSPADIDST